jgi:hypothetical protein
MTCAASTRLPGRKINAASGTVGRMPDRSRENSRKSGGERYQAKANEWNHRSASAAEAALTKKAPPKLPAAMTKQRAAKMASRGLRQGREGCGRRNSA